MIDPGTSLPLRPLGPITRMDRVDSTNEAAFRALGAGSAVHGAVFVADSQEAGRGRRGARWVSVPGEGLYLSAIWQPAQMIPVPLLTMATGVATLQALLGILGQTPDLCLKWPNDVVAGEAKLAGILVESRGLDPARPTFVVGIGINVSQTAFPPELLAERPVTSLRMLGWAPTREEVQTSLLKALPSAWYLAESDPKQLCHQYLLATALEGKIVQVEVSEDRFQGRVLALDAELGLELEDSAGIRRRLRLEQIRSLRPLAG